MNKAQPSLLRRVWKDFIQQHWLKLVIAIVFMLVEAATMWLFVRQIQPMIDDIFQAQEPTAVAPIAWIIGAIFVARGLSSFIHRTLTIRTGLAVVCDIQQRLSDHIVSLDMKFFNYHSPGELIDRVRGDTLSLQALASTSLLTCGRDLTILLAMLITAMQVDFLWTLFLFIGAPIIAIPVMLLHTLIRNQTTSAREASAKLSTHLDEIFHGIKAIKLNNIQSTASARSNTYLSFFLKKMTLVEISKACLPAMIDVIAGVGFVAVLLYGGMEVINGEKSTGEFMTFFAAIALMFDPIRRLANLSGALQSAQANLKRIYYVFDQQPKDRQLVSKFIPDPSADIVFNDVSFAYKKDQKVLDQVSFRARGGQITAFVGASGAGKSTLFHLLTQLEEPTSGTITIGDTDLGTVDLTELRANIAVVSQEAALFDESIYSNISYGDLSKSPPEVGLVAQEALVDQFTSSMPQGIQSSAGPRGSNLSGGQRQRVVIARALLRNAPILLLDEATSALDSQTEGEIHEVLDRYAENRTTLIIAHRLTTVMNADQIYVLNEGKIVECGHHQMLLEQNGYYAQLYKTFER